MMAALLDKEELAREQHYKLRTAKELIDKAEKDGRTLSDDEQRTISDLKSEADKIKAQIVDIEKTEALKASVDSAIQADLLPRPRQTAPMQPTNGEHPDSRPKIEFARYGALKAFTGGATRAEDEMRAYRAGQWAHAALFNSPKAQRFCRENGIEVRAMSEGVNTAGGYYVPPEMSQSIIDLREQYGVFRRYAEIEPMSRDSITVPREVGDLTAYFSGEGDSGTESDITLDGITLTAKKLKVLTRFSSELNEDAIINLADRLAMKAAWAFAYKEDLCGFMGDGTSTYGSIQGIVPKFEAGTTLAGYVDCVTGHDTFAEVDIADITTLMGVLPEYASMRNPAFFCSKPFADIVFGRLAATAGGNTIQSMAGGLQRTFLGYPIVVSQVLLKALTAQDNKVFCLFGDLGLAAKLGDRREITLGLSEHKYWVEDQISLKATERLDINVHSIGDTTNAGPIVALIGKTS